MVNYKDKIHENYLDIAQIRNSIGGVPGSSLFHICSNVLDNQAFQHWTAAGHDTQHHYGTGGLIQHTKEVIQIALNNNKILNLGLNQEQIFLAALYHDFGKIYEYEAVDKDDEIKYNLTYSSKVISDLVNCRVTWTKTPQKDLVYHIVRSAMMWENACQSLNYNDINSEILHAILAHHGRREWKSPVLPQTKLAWLIHLSDITSARLCDCLTSISLEK